MQLRILQCFLTVGIVCFYAATVQGGTYKTSAHGSTTYGVERPDLQTAGFAVGNCAHCHEQHASVGGSEPAPFTGPKEYLLFDQSNTDQATNFCFDCHGTGISYQTDGHVTNRSYSYRAGGWDADPLSSNIKSAFAQASSHNLGDIVTFAAGQAWKYTANSNACAVCHDPHVVQGDPANDLLNGNFPKAAGGGFVITEINTSPGNLWGDAVDENINFNNNYLAPWRALSTSYEPDGDLVSDGSNLPDYIAFCTTCHDAGNAVYSTERGGNLKVIDWSASGDIHGKANAVDIAMLGTGPYPSATLTTYVLSCLDCHEPHGSGSIYLLRGKVNGQPTGTIANGFDFDKICRQCHDPRSGVLPNDWENEHHGGSDPAYEKAAPCTDCHIVGTNPIDCVQCHFHGAVAGTPPVPDTTPVGTLRKTF